MEYADNPVVLAPGAAGEWDAGAIGSTCILKVDDTFHAYYEAWGRLSHDGGGGDYKSLKVGHATSKDGINWVSTVMSFTSGNLLLKFSVSMCLLLFSN